MFKCFSLVLGTLIFASLAGADTTAVEKECRKETPLEKNLSDLKEITGKVEKCPKPTKAQIAEICSSVYSRQKNASDAALTYRYQDTLWSMSCAEPGKETILEAKIKIQKMWIESREEFRCVNSENIPTDGNILKLSITTHFPFFIIEAVKKFELDMNFKDPSDGKTILDFIQDRLTFYKESSGDQSDVINEYSALYKLLASKGAKHGKDL